MSVASGVRRLAGTVCTGVVLWGMMAGSPAAAGEAAETGYRLLFLGGQSVKWGTPALGAPALIRYAFIDQPAERPGAINCRSMRPFPNTLGRNAVPREDIVAEFDASFRAWERIAGVRFEPADDEADADLLLGVQARPRGIAYADVIPHRRKMARATLSTMTTIRQAAVCLNPTVRWETAFDGDNTRTRDIRYVATHEIGHILGLDHERGRADSIMSFQYRERFRTPQPGDVAGVKLLYGSPRPLQQAATGGAHD